MRSFFEAIWQDRPKFGEIRALKPGAAPYQAFMESGPYPVYELFEAQAFRLSAEGWDVYYGVLPRMYASGTAADVDPWTQVIWADVDAKKQSDVMREGKMLALEAINAFPIPPQILVDSGGGYHAYWRLTQLEPLERAQAVMRWIADEIQGDKVQDGPRILRVPGTLNRKRDIPVPCRLLRMNLDRRVRLSDLEGYLPITRDEPAAVRAPRLRQDMPEWLGTLIEDGAPQGQRSETVFRVVVWLMRYGRSPEEIKDIIRATPDGIGAKYDEKSQWDGERYLDYVITAADKVA